MMKAGIMRVILFALVCGLAAPASAATLLVPGTAGSGQRSTGVNGEDLADTPVTDSIPHKAGEAVIFNALVTPGTTSDMTVSCEESPDNSNWSWIPECVGGTTKTCGKAVLDFPDIETVTDVSVIVHGTQGYVRCTFDDSADGTGTLILYGSIL